MKIGSKRLALIVSVVLAIGVAGCGGDSGPEGPPGGYGEGGFPLDEQGNVSDNPEDYREAVCDALGEQAVDYEEECQ